MELNYLLDTDVISEPFKLRPSRTLLRHLAKHTGQMAIASTTWFELTSGVENMPEGKKKTARREMLGDIRKLTPILAYDDRAAGWHGEEHIRLSKNGKRIPLADGQIAAVARMNNLTLVTANVKDFEWFHGLTVENWMRA